MNVVVTQFKVPSRNLSGGTGANSGKFVSEVRIQSVPSRTCCRNDKNYIIVFELIGKETVLVRSLLEVGPVQLSRCICYALSVRSEESCFDSRQRKEIFFLSKTFRQARWSIQHPVLGIPCIIGARSDSVLCHLALRLILRGAARPLLLLLSWHSKGQLYACSRRHLYLFMSVRTPRMRSCLCCKTEMNFCPSTILLDLVFNKESSYKFPKAFDNIFSDQRVTATYVASSRKLDV